MWAKQFMFKSVYAARSDDQFFTGESEIYDFVYERIKRRISAMIYRILLDEILICLIE